MIEVDPFDLPDWLGEGGVTWAPEDGIHGMHLVRGRLAVLGQADLPCDLLALRLVRVGLGNRESPPRDDGSDRGRRCMREQALHGSLPAEMEGCTANMAVT